MAPQVSVSGFTPLRVVTQRLSSTPAKHMARVAPSLAASIMDCKEILSSSTNHGHGKDASETAVLVHKLKSQLSVLLQEKVVEARWAAVVLIKASVEVGGWEVLRGSGAWVRGLLGLLGVRPLMCLSNRLLFAFRAQQHEPCSFRLIRLWISLLAFPSSCLTDAYAVRRIQLCRPNVDLKAL